MAAGDHRLGGLIAIVATAHRDGVEGGAAIIGAGRLGLAAERDLPRRRAGRARARREDEARDFYATATGPTSPAAGRAAAGRRGAADPTARIPPLVAASEARRASPAVASSRDHLDPPSPTSRARATAARIDTEFMGEGRYRPLLCLVQVAVDGRRARRGRASRCSTRSRTTFDPAPARRRARRPRGRDRLARRPPGRRAAAPRVGHRGHEHLRHAGRRRVRRRARSSATRRCSPSSLGVRLRKSASFTRWDARPAQPRSRSSYAREDVLHLLELADAIQDAPRRARAARSGPARSAARSRTSPTSATPTRSSPGCRA